MPIRNLLLIALLVGIMIFGASCIPSEKPLYQEKDLVFDPSLLGKWENELVLTHILFKKGEGKSYEAFILPEGSQTTTETLKVHLVELAGIRFLDIVPVPRKGAPEYGKKDQFHYFARIHREGNYLGVTPFNKNWVRQTIESKKSNLKHKEQNGELVLTDETAELQEFVVKYAEDSGAFPNAMGFFRGEEE